MLVVFFSKCWLNLFVFHTMQISHCEEKKSNKQNKEKKDHNFVGGWGSAAALKFSVPVKTSHPVFSVGVKINEHFWSFYVFEGLVSDSVVISVSCSKFNRGPIQPAELLLTSLESAHCQQEHLSPDTCLYRVSTSKLPRLHLWPTLSWFPSTPLPALICFT